MIFYIEKESGEVYAYDQEQVAGGWVKKGLTKMTPAQIDAHINPPPTAEGERAKRDDLLRHLDATVSNPLRYASLTVEQQTALADYRQLLLDVPDQEGFPLTIEWPVMPAI